MSPGSAGTSLLPRLGDNGCTARRTIQADTVRVGRCQEAGIWRVPYRATCRCDELVEHRLVAVTCGKRVPPPTYSPWVTSPGAVWCSDLVAMWHWLLHVLGVDSQSSYWYDAWSGCIPALLTSTTITGTAIAVLHKHTCHVAGCYRPGKYTAAGGQFFVCRKHHPDDPVTPQDVQSAHEKWRDDSPGY